MAAPPSLRSTYLSYCSVWGTFTDCDTRHNRLLSCEQELCVVEAMKMQNVLHATRDGTVKSLLAQPGSTLSADQPIIAFEQTA